MHATELELVDFRCYERAELTLAPGVTVVVGDNGTGKTSLLEGLGWAATTHSFRGVPDAALVRAGAEQAVVRVEVVDGERQQLIEAELRSVGRNRILRNHQAVTRTRDLLGTLLVTVFAPDDLELVKGAPSGRRTYLDDLLVGVAPRYDAVRSEYDRVLRQRNAMLRGGVRDQEARTTLEVFDDQLVRAGASLVAGRLRLIERLRVTLTESYRMLAGAETAVSARYHAEWMGDAGPDSVESPDAVKTPEAVETMMRSALATVHRRELERGVTLVGPHRDDWHLGLDGLEARTQASQGEQRTLALAMRLAGHRVTREVTGTAPVLLLDDVFSELDEHRSNALVAHLESDQTVMTTAGALPAGIRPDRVVRIAAGRLEAA